ncbi:hypothetical protein [Maribacter sp.]|nr:hypothetical protein [Maribacter sp.]
MKKCLIMFGLLLALLLVAAFTEDIGAMESMKEDVVLNVNLDRVEVRK